MILHNDYILLERKDDFAEVLKKANEEEKTLKTYSVEDGDYSGNDICNGSFDECLEYIKKHYAYNDDCDYRIALIHIGKSGGCEYTEEVWDKEVILEILDFEK